MKRKALISTILFMLSGMILSSGCVVPSQGTTQETTTSAPAESRSYPDYCEQARVHIRQGLVYSGQHDWENSEREFKKAINLSRDTCREYGEAYANLGVTYIQMNSLNKAENALKKAVAVNNRLRQIDPAAYYNLAVVYSLNGKLDLALDNLDAALNQGFNEIDALRSDPDLDNLRQDPKFTKVLEKYHIFLK